MCQGHSLELIVPLKWQWLYLYCYFALMSKFNFGAGEIITSSPNVFCFSAMTRHMCPMRIWEKRKCSTLSATSPIFSTRFSQVSGGENNGNVEFAVFFDLFILMRTYLHSLPSLDIKVYSALGNHDYHPKSQLPAASNYMYDRIAEMWQDWLDIESQETFKKGGQSLLWYFQIHCFDINTISSLSTSKTHTNCLWYTNYNLFHICSAIVFFPQVDITQKSC